MATSFILWWGIAGLVWTLLLSRKMADKVDRAMEILGLWLLAVLGILGLPQYFPSPLGMQLSIIITATAAIGITLFLCLGETKVPLEPPLPDREKEDFRNAVATETYAILKTFIVELNYRRISYWSWSSKADQSRVAILGKEDYFVLRSLYDAIDERNEYFDSRHGFDVPTLEPLNRKCVEALSRVYSEITWLRISSDTESLLSDARRNVGLVASEAHMKRQEERMRLVYGPLYSAVSSMRQRENDPHRRFTLGTRFNPWTDYPEIMQKVIDVFVNCPDLVENDRVSKGWADNESKLRTRDFWLGGKEVYEWFDAIEEEFHRIDSELRARSSSS